MKNPVHPTSMTTDRYTDILKKHWGYDSFRGIQREIIESICNGKDTLGLMPTGGGKSITFQVPALAMQGVCLVITPLIALMKDQVENLRKRGIKAYAIYGSMPHAEILRILDNAVLGGVTLLYVSPERLSSELFITKLQHMQVSFITVDEAHCICQWGFDFRPSYLNISAIRHIKPGAPVLALTATATPSAIKEIQKQLAFREENVFRMSFKRKNLSYIVRETISKEEEMIHILNAVDGCAIVYTHNRQKTKDTAQALTDRGISATYYHAGLDHETRNQRQTMWQEGKVRVIVATNAFGMGIDKPDVRLVIHLDCPDSIEEYFQEAGRAGRDGKRSYAVLLKEHKDADTLRNRIWNSFPDKEYIRRVYEHLAYFFQLATGSGAGHSFEFAEDKFCKYFRHHPIQMKPALSILQMAGYIEYQEDADCKTRIRFLIDRDDLYRLRELSDEENNIITAMLRMYSGMFSDFVFVNEKDIAEAAGTTPHLAYILLKTLDRKRIIQFIPSKKVPYIRYSRDRVETKDLTIPASVYEQRKKLFTLRIEHMIQYLENNSQCRSRMLLEYLGEKTDENCGHCDVCIQHKKDAQAEAQDIEAAKAAIRKLLADGKPHKPSELESAGTDTKLIRLALQTMAYDEEVKNQNGMICL